MARRDLHSARSPANMSTPVQSFACSRAWLSICLLRRYFYDRGLIASGTALTLYGLVFLWVRGGCTGMRRCLLAPLSCRHSAALPPLFIVFRRNHTALSIPASPLRTCPSPSCRSHGLLPPACT